MQLSNWTTAILIFSLTRSSILIGDSFNQLTLKPCFSGSRWAFKNLIALTSETISLLIQAHPSQVKLLIARLLNSKYEKSSIKSHPSLVIDRNYQDIDWRYCFFNN